MIDDKTLDWKKGDGLIPAIIQDAATRQVLMLGYMNAEALQPTSGNGKSPFFLPLHVNLCGKRVKRLA